MTNELVELREQLKILAEKVDKLILGQYYIGIMEDHTPRLRTVEAVLSVFKNATEPLTAVKVKELLRKNFPNQLYLNIDQSLVGMEKRGLLISTKKKHFRKTYSLKK